MVSGQYLCFEDMIDKLKKAKEDLEKDNETLEKVKKEIRVFISDEESFKGETASSVQIQMSEYILVTNAMIQANDCDIADCETMISELDSAQGAVGDDDLIGEVIYDQMDNARRMAAQDRERAVEIDRMQTKSHNPFADAWYQMKEIYYKQCAEYNDELYKEWKKKSDKYDEVENNTLNLFENGEQLRQQAENGLRELGKNFNGKSFEVNDDYEWETPLVKLVNEKGYVGLEEDFLTIFDYYWDDEAGVWRIRGDAKFGGDQGWFKQDAIDEFLKTADLTDDERKLFEDKELNKALTEGCSIIALMNMFYMMEGKTVVNKKDYMIRLYKYLDKHPDVREEIIKKNGGLVGEQAFSSTNQEDLLEEYMEEHGHYREVEMEYVDDSRLGYIEKEIKAKRPVALNTPSTNGLTWYEKTDGKLSEDETIKKGKDAGHSVVITGIADYCDPYTYERKKYVEVSSWGKKYYIPYEELEKNGAEIAVNKWPK